MLKLRRPAFIGLPLFVVLTVGTFLSTATLAREGRLLRFPDLSAENVVFVYAGDIWLVPRQGGQAFRLTSHEGLELFPKFSPDGQQIAFSAEYSGNRQVYVLPLSGGTPRQLTYYNDVGPMPPRGGFDYQVLDWSPDGEQVLFRANRLPWGERMGRPYVIAAAGGLEVPLPVPEGGGGMFSPDGSKLVYTPIARAFRTWKRYRGGRAQDVWIFDLESLQAERLTDFEGTDNQPVWVKDTIYFTSDRERRLNLYSLDPKSHETRQVTSHKDFDVLWPSAGPDAVVYECGGYLYLFDPRDNASKRIPIELRGDFEATLPQLRNVARDIHSFDLSPTGKRALFGARGDVFTVPAEHGEIRNLTQTPGAREIDPAWSPDGRSVAYWGDQTGEYELYVTAQDGSGEPRQVTRDGNTWRFPALWSPDSKKLAYGDKKQRLRIVDVESGDTVDVDHAKWNDLITYSWSPDSRWLAYTKVGDSQFSSIYVYSLADKKSTQLTSDFTNDTEPVFDPKGRYLYFLSDRDFNLTFSAFEFNYLYTQSRRVYVATLQRSVPALLAPKSDEEKPADGGDEAKDETRTEALTAEDTADSAMEVMIDVDGFEERVIALPGNAGQYASLQANDSGVFFLEGSQLQFFDLEKEETQKVLDGVPQYVLSHDGKKLLFRSGTRFGIAKAAPEQKTTEGLLDLDHLETRIEPVKEWQQIFVDGWRLTRDWFYEPNLHGVDWTAMRKLYQPLVDAVAHRADLDYVFGELGGELAAGHFYVNWGDFPRPERVDNGLLGAELELDESGYLRIEHIFTGENWHDDTRSPLTEPGVVVDEGDFILAVDGRSTRSVKNFYELLEAKANQVVTLTVNDRPDLEGSRDEKVRPIASETSLRYLDWVRSRRELVDRLSNGRIGYIHLPNTGAPGNQELHKYFLPQAHKDALIFDVRYNGGGFIPDRMLELLTRQRLSYWARRGIEPSRTPGYAHEGPKVCLINGYSASGGDAFPYYFRELGLGKLIGTRTWGGLIGLSGNPGFSDGGSLNIPTFRFFDLEGRWAVENEGVSPDIEVLDRPDWVAAGRDPTLEKAVEVLLEELEREPAPHIRTPEPPSIRR